MAVRYARAQSLAARAAAVAPCHLGRGPGLADEDEALRIEIEQALVPVRPLLQDVGAFLLHRVRGPFSQVSPWRAQKRDRASIPKQYSRSTKCACNSASVMSLRSSISARI